MEITGKQTFFQLVLKKSVSQLKVFWGQDLFCQLTLNTIMIKKKEKKCKEEQKLMLYREELKKQLISIRPILTKFNERIILTEFN